MRIITGSAKGIQLRSLASDETRPTADRVKEAIFSKIQFDIEGRRVLDLFGGSGQLALEALSRGAAGATIIDASRAAAELIIENAKRAKLFDRCRISACDYAFFLRGAAGQERFHIVFLDPPYNTSLLHDSLEKIAKADILTPDAYIICESDAQPTRGNRQEKKKDSATVAAKVLAEVFASDETLAAQYHVIKSDLYGRTRITLLTTAQEDQTLSGEIAAENR